MIKLPFFECKRCGHKWIPRRPQEPEVCPKCKSPYWKKDRRRAKDRKNWYLEKEVKENERKENEEKNAVDRRN